MLVRDVPRLVLTEEPHERQRRLPMLKPLLHLKQLNSTNHNDELYLQKS